MAKKPRQTPPEDSIYIFRASITLRNGKKIFARQYGLNAFRIRVKPDNDNGSSPKS
ncbi:hypothetical protein Sa4125_39030 [Aureimonas sp. SA4125]|uniref:hypothetical protein n=1 Tax=Aureimonas sp. SA4125 TaxID=2826993 RepID=UPI001CC45F82|nr:hypothetical protein [Aureimonas sp. SA4125]BDA86361.1 hypothetical protein Sa4125_39030 [Aureimonas sp. SA4125]